MGHRRNRFLATTKSAKAARRVAWFGEPCLLPGEDREKYDELCKKFASAIKPAGVIEAIWVRDLADLTWEIVRLRRLKDTLITATCHEGLAEVLTIFFDYSDAKNLAEQWAVREEAAIRRVDKLLVRAGLTIEAAVAKTLSLKLNEIERIDRMIMSAEARRNNTFRELDRHRTALASAAKRAVDDVEDAEFKVVEPGAAKTQFLTQGRPI